MTKRLLIGLVLCICSQLSYAGFSSYSNYNSSGAIIAPLTISDKGMYNLIVSVEWLSEPYDKSPYSSDNYQELLQRLQVEWKGRAIQRILNSPEIKAADLAELKKGIEADIQAVIDTAKSKYRIPNESEVVFSVNSFYLSEIDSE